VRRRHGRERGVEESTETDVEGSETEDAEVEGVKVGHSTDASSRVSQYVEDIADKVRRMIGDRKGANISDDDLELVVLINIDCLLVKSQKEVVAFLLDKLKALTFDKFPTTIGEAINHDRTGIPFSAQALIFSLINGVDDCNMVGGGIDVNGILLRFVMNALETGMTEWLRAKGVKINDLACLDELFHNNYMGLFVEILVEICEDLTKMFAKLSSAYPHDADKVAKLVIMIAEAVLSWPVDLENKAPDFVLCKIVASNSIFGRDHWVDAFDRPPPKRPKSEDDEGGPYDPGYSPRAISSSISRAAST